MLAWTKLHEATTCNPNRNTGNHGRRGVVFFLINCITWVLRTAAKQVGARTGPQQSAANAQVHQRASEPLAATQTRSAFLGCCTLLLKKAGSCTRPQLSATNTQVAQRASEPLAAPANQASLKEEYSKLPLNMCSREEQPSKCSMRKLAHPTRLRRSLTPRPGNQSPSPTPSHPRRR